MSSLNDLLDAIDAATAPACAVCAGPLGDSPSADFCSPECQESWHQTRAAAARSVLAAPDAAPYTCGNIDCWCCGTVRPDELAADTGDPVELHRAIADALADHIDRFYDELLGRQFCRPSGILVDPAAPLRVQAAQRDQTLTPSAPRVDMPGDGTLAVLGGMPVRIDSELPPDEIRILDHTGRVLRSWRVDTGPPAPQYATGGYVTPYPIRNRRGRPA